MYITILHIAPAASSGTENSRNLVPSSSSNEVPSSSRIYEDDGYTGTLVSGNELARANLADTMGLLPPYYNLQICIDRVKEAYPDNIIYKEYPDCTPSKLINPDRNILRIYFSDSFVNKTIVTMSIYKQEAKDYYDHLFESKGFENILGNYTKVKSPTQFCELSGTKNKIYYLGVDCHGTLQVIGLEPNISGLDAFEYLFHHHNWDTLEYNKLFKIFKNMDKPIDIDIRDRSNYKREICRRNRKYTIQVELIQSFFEYHLSAAESVKTEKFSDISKFCQTAINMDAKNK